jgi:cytochrome c
MVSMRPLLSAAVLAAGLTAAAAQASPQIAMKAGCATCHAPDRKLIGPSYKEIAARYKADPKAAAKLAESTRKGSTGTWGKVPMPPSDAGKISDADLQAVIAWILKTP